MKHVMLDLETFGKKPGCIIRSVGAVFFDLAGGTGKEFYMNVDAASCEAIGLVYDPDTVAWWKKQSKEAQDGLVADQRKVLNVITGFNLWFKQNGGQNVWCQGASFDAPVWEAVCEAAGTKAPWQFWAIRDTRTVYDLFDFDPKTIKRGGTYHNPLADAQYQVECVQTAYAKHRVAAKLLERTMRAHDEYAAGGLLS